MAPSRAPFKRSEKGLLTPDNCVVTLIDLQPQMLFGVANFDRQAIINNNVALSKAARVFEVPVVLSTVETKSFSGNMWPQGGVLNVEIHRSWKPTSLCFKSSKTSELSRHLHFQNTTSFSSKSRTSPCFGQATPLEERRRCDERVS